MTATATIQPYRAVASDRDLASHLSDVDEQLYRNYGCDFEFGGPGKIVTGALTDFERLLEALAALPYVEFVPHIEMARTPCPPDKLRVGFRHDIDGDISAAARQAELQEQYGVRATWYILHTAPYYGRFHRDHFERYECMAPYYRRLQACGHEVALHTDGLHVYQEHGLDGADAIRTEIAWLRGLGLDLRGTVAHNSKPVYGAWNYEIFRGRRDPDDDRPEAELPDHVVHDGRWAALRVLDEAALRLEYEGNDVLWQKHTPLEYGATRAANLWRWKAHDRRRRHEPQAPEARFLDQERMIRAIAALAPGQFVVLVVHPCYYGARSRRRAHPMRQAHRSQARHDTALGWFTWAPDCVHTFGSRRRDGGPDYQTAHRPNELGMLDRPWPRRDEIDAAPSDQVRVLVLGGDNVDGATVHHPRCLTAHLETLLEQHANRRACVRKLAHPGMGASRLWPWLDRTIDRLRPRFAVLGIGDRAAQGSVPALFAPEAGVSRAHPPGDYLDWDAERDTLVERRASGTWELHRTTPRAANDDALIRALGAKRAPRLRELDVEAFLIAVYRRLAERARTAGAEPVLLVEDRADMLTFETEAARDAYVEHLDARIRRIAEACACDVIDPTERFAACPLPKQHDACRQWNGTAHRLAAEAVYAWMTSADKAEA